MLKCARSRNGSRYRSARRRAWAISAAFSAADCSAVPVSTYNSACSTAATERFSSIRCCLTAERGQRTRAMGGRELRRDRPERRTLENKTRETPPLAGLPAPTQEGDDRRHDAADDEREVAGHELRQADDEQRRPGQLLPELVVEV